MCFSALHWHRDDMEFILFEPQRDYYAQLVAAAQGRSNVTIHNVAIGDNDGVAQFYDEGTSSSLVGVASPSFQHKGETERTGYEVEVRRISDYDFGQIDVLRADIEGAEWFALKHLVSRPAEIVVETYNDLGTYINPFLYEIMRWGREQGYQLVSVQDSDFMFRYAPGTQISPIAASPETVSHSIEQYDRWIKGTIIAAYSTTLLQREDPDQFVTTLHQIFQRKQKVFRNLAIWAKKEVEKRGKPLAETINNLSFFAGVLRTRVDKNLNQPLRQP